MSLEFILKKLTEANPNVTLKKFEEPTLEEKPRPKRCEFGGCKAKITLANVACKCNGYYCPTHRFSQSHTCSFDYSAEAKDRLTKQLVKVEGSKLNTI